MSPLLKYREKLNLTQEQLSIKANISVRTIQRIEAGSPPKGYTLEALANALDINKEELLENTVEKADINFQLIKIINLSSLLLIFLPLGSILIPAVIMYWKKEVNAITKQIVTIQILWTISFPIIVLLMALISKWFSINKHLLPLTMLLLFAINLYIILRNAVEINKNKKLRIDLKFSIL